MLCKMWERVWFCVLGGVCEWHVHVVWYFFYVHYVCVTCMCSVFVVLKGYYECSCSCSLGASLWRHVRLHDGNQNTSSKTLTIITILGKSDQDPSSTLTSLLGSISVSLGTPWGLGGNAG